MSAATSQAARLAVVEARVEAMPARLDAIDKRLRSVELLIASGIGALAVLQIIIGLVT